VFDFGPLRTGHYTLAIDGEDSFDVEIKELPQVTESVTIDVPRSTLTARGDMSST